jgi:hypothetical protein
LCFILQFNACFVAFIKCSPPPRAFTTHQGSRPQHRTSGSRHSHNSPVFRSALPTSPLPYSCRSPEFTSYCVAPKEGELMHDLAVHYNHWRLRGGWVSMTYLQWVNKRMCSFGTWNVQFFFCHSFCQFATEQGTNALWAMCRWSHQPVIIDLFQINVRRVQIQRNPAWSYMLWLLGKLQHILM